MPRKKSTKAPLNQPELLDVTAALKTAPCVPALREAVKAWRAGGYKGVTDTTRTLLNHWFLTDHKLRSGKPFKYHDSQREAVETLVFVWECEKVRTRKALLERYALNDKDLRLPMQDEFARYCVKMATGSGKTKVMSLAIAWQYLNAAREDDESYAKTFLLIAPNVIVLERLKTDFANGVIFRNDPVVPKELELFWNFDCVVRGDAERPHSDGMLFLTNIQQLYDRAAPDDDEPEAMTAVLGPKPPANKLDVSDFTDRIALRAGRVMVVNDEAHHTHDEDLKWNEVIIDLNKKTPLSAQLDFSATPRFQKGAIFPWTISDYPLKQAIIDGVVKRPMKGIANIDEAKSQIASVKYKGFLTAAVERWKEYRDQLDALKKKPILFVMLNSTDEADDVAEWLRTVYPKEFGAEKTQVIHTKKSGDVTEKELDVAREAVRNVDRSDSPIHAIVSVLMLREGWDVQNVTVVVGLRPYSAKAKILPEQTIGRGLRLMFRDSPVGSYTERVDVIGNKAFLDFVDDLEKLEDLKLDTFELGKEKLHIVTILPVEERKKYDIGLPELSPMLVRKKSLAEEIEALNVMTFQTILLPMSGDDPKSKTFKYDGFDIITLEKMVERQYTLADPQTAQEVIGYYARRIAEAVKLPSQFAVIAPKVREFFAEKAFGQHVDLEDREIVKAMGTNPAQYVCVSVFTKELRQLSIEEKTPELLQPNRMLSECKPFPWSRPVWEGHKCIFNLTPCENGFEREFAKFLDNAKDVDRFAKLPQIFGFALDYTDTANNLRSYYPDFVAVDEDGTHFILETKGQETSEVARKDAAAVQWCESATELTGTTWKYLKIPQKEFEMLQPRGLKDLSALSMFS